MRRTIFFGQLLALRWRLFDTSILLDEKFHHFFFIHRFLLDLSTDFIQPVQIKVGSSVWPKNRRNFPASEFFNIDKVSKLQLNNQRVSVFKNQLITYQSENFLISRSNYLISNNNASSNSFSHCFLKFLSHKGSQWKSIVLQDSFLKLGCCFNLALLLLSSCLFCRSGWSPSYYLPQKGAY